MAIETEYSIAIKTYMESILMDRDYTLIIDKSGSMSTDDCKGKTRWDSCQESTLSFARELNKIDPDGITLYTFSSSFKRYENVTPSVVEQVFKENRPAGSTNLADVLKDSLDNYLSRKKAGKTKPNGEIILVITDGQPDDAQAVKNIISDTSQKLDNDNELGISFIQIGSDSGARKFLKELDDALPRAKFDIVDTKTMDEVENAASFADILIAALQD